MLLRKTIAYSSSIRTSEKIVITLKKRKLQNYKRLIYN